MQHGCRGLAEGGGICIAGTVYDHVKDKLTLRYDYLGKQTVKNIAEPLRAYRVLMEPLTSAARLNTWKRRGLDYWKRVAPGLHRSSSPSLLAANAVWPLYTHYISRPVEVASPEKAVAVASKEKMAFPLPDKPSIAVLPFTNMSDDPSRTTWPMGWLRRSSMPFQSSATSL